MTDLIRRSAPSSLFVTAQEIKSSARITNSREDSFFQQCANGACAAADGPTGHLKRAVINQGWTLVTNSFEAVLPLGAHTLDGIRYLDEDEAEQTVDPALYRASNGRSSFCPILRVDQSWPEKADADDAVMIDFTAGYGNAPGDVPQDIRHATIMLGVHYYENRSASIGDPRLSEVSRDVTMGYNSLMQGHIDMRRYF